MIFHLFYIQSLILVLFSESCHLIYPRQQELLTWKKIILECHVQPLFVHGKTTELSDHVLLLIVKVLWKRSCGHCVQLLIQFISQAIYDLLHISAFSCIFPPGVKIAPSVYFCSSIMPVACKVMSWWKWLLSKREWLVNRESHLPNYKVSRVICHQDVIKSIGKKSLIA